RPQSVRMAPLARRLPWTDGNVRRRARLLRGGPARPTGHRTRAGERAPEPGCPEATFRMSAFAFGAGVLIGGVGVGFGRFAFARLATASLTLFWPPQIVISTVRGLAEL